MLRSEHDDQPADPVPGNIRRRGDLNIDRSAWILIRRFGKSACQIAEIRARYCRHLGRQLSAAKWLCVHIKVLELTVDEPVGPLH